MEYVWLFLLFFAALAAGWFYLQRAKARPSATVAPPEAAVSADPARDGSHDRPAT